MAPPILFLLLLIGIQAFAASGCFETERNALLAFKAELIDPRNRLASWKSQNCCAWKGVVCSNTTGHILKLNLRNSYDKIDYFPYGKRPSGLGGKISPSLLLLNHLEHLDLSLNNFSEIRIPEYFGSLKKLRYLNLSGACFGATLPPQLGNLSKLHYLDLSSFDCDAYNMGVDNFWWLARLTSLHYLDISFVKLSSATYWLQVINMLPSLKYLDMSWTSLPNIPISLPYLNITTLGVLKLAGNIINSTLPRWLWNLTSITHLDLFFNEFHGFIPDELSCLKSLNVLSLGTNNFEGLSPKAFSNLCCLNTLDLSVVGFSGEINKWIERLPSCVQQNLQILYCRYNELRGNLSGWLENMTSLTEIDLTGNSLNGTIPTGVWTLPSLTRLNLDSNFFEGTITEVQLSHLQGLKWLDLSYNSFNMQISHDWIPPFQLKTLHLASCNLGPKFPTWLQGQTQLEELGLSKNEIDDTLPNWLWKISNLVYVRISSNRIKGTLPLSLDHVMLHYLNLSSNQLEGPLPTLPQTLSLLDLSNNFFTGPIPNSTLLRLQYLLLSNNSFDGNLPFALCQLTSLQVLDISNNKLSGEIPPCLGMLQDQLLVLDMMNNTLSGKVPTSLGKLGALLILDLSNNSLSGEIPSSLQYCTQLVNLNLGYNNFSGTIPKWIGESLPVLMVLSLCSNTFSGSIPSEIVQLGYLRALDLSHNNLSGSIPRSIGELSWKKGVPTDHMLYLQYGSFDVSAGSVYLVVKGKAREYSKLLYLFKTIDLSCNNLYGEIPDEIENLQALHSLNLSMNDLTGHIPDQIGKMQALESLDVAMNKLSGTIPQSLASLYSLSSLNVSYNNLSGKIPSGNQLQTLDDPSIYIGNPYLCGPPTTQSCSTNETIIIFGKKSHDRFEKLGLYISMVLGFIIGFWIFFGTLLLSRSFRNTYFSAIDRTYDRLYVAVALTLIRLRRR